MDLAPFCQLVKQRTGLLFREGEDVRLSQAVEKRMRVHQMTSPQGYLRRLQSDGAEFQELIHLLTINETYFFREAAPIWFLTDHLFLRFLQGRQPGQPVRILSIGCSTGEEPYSMVMAHFHRYGSSCQPFISVIAADIDMNALSRARDGIYTSYSFRNLAADFRQRYFHTLGGSRYQLDEEIRRQVRFVHFNILQEEHPAELRNLDVIFFRNVSIYFDLDTRIRILGHFRKMLREDGCLIVGMTETLANDVGQFSLVEEEKIFYFTSNKPVVEKSLPPPVVSPPPQQSPLPSPLPPPKVILPVSQPTDVGFPQALHLALEKRYDQAMAMIDQLLAMSPVDVRLWQLAAHIHINRRHFDLAEQAAHHAQEREPWSLETALLLGQIYRLRQEWGQAVAWFRKAIYIRSDCWLAHYHLAELYRRDNQPQLAAKEYRIVLQQAQSVRDNIFSFFPLSVSLEEVGFLCKHHLNILDPSGQRRS